VFVVFCLKENTITLFWKNHYCRILSVTVGYCRYSVKNKRKFAVITIKSFVEVFCSGVFILFERIIKYIFLLFREGKSNFFYILSCIINRSLQLVPTIDQSMTERVRKVNKF